MTATFPNYSNGQKSDVLPDGNYFGWWVDPSQTTSDDGLASTDFFVPTADANHDRSVDSADFEILAANFGGTDKTFSQGDFNYDGTVNALDFNALATKYGASLPAPSNVELSAYPTATDEIHLDWTDVSGATSYRVEISHDSGTTFDDSTDVDASPTKAAVVQLTHGTDYAFRVTAFDSSGDISTSNIADTTIIQELPAKPGNLTATTGAGGTVQLNWWDLADDPVKKFFWNRRIQWWSSWIKQVDCYRRLPALEPS